MMNRAELKQKTLNHEFTIDGIGLHSGHPASVTVRPAPPNQGIVFIRTDLPHSPSIKACFENVTETKLATTLSKNGIKISTVEHLLAALSLCGVDNALIEVSGPEVPILDGSAALFCASIERVGLFHQDVLKTIAVVKKKIIVRKADKVASIEPDSRLSIHASVSWEHPCVGTQKLSYFFGSSLPEEISAARTFGFLKDVESLKKAGLARGGSLDNAIVLDEEKVLNPDGLRYPNEFVRHKVLDAVGDFALAPLPMLGKIELNKAGHELHAELVHAVFSNPDNYQVMTLDEIIHSERNSEAIRAASVSTTKRTANFFRN